MENWQEISGTQSGSLNSSKELTQFIAKIFRNWYWFVICAVLGFGLAYLYVRYQTPIYKINAKILVNDEKKGGALGGQSELLDLGGLLGAKSSVDNEAEILKTRNLMEQVVRELNANVTYYYNGRIRRVELYESPFVVRLLNIKDSIPPTIVNFEAINNSNFEITTDEQTIKATYNKPFILQGIGKVEIQRRPWIPILYEEYTFSITSVDEMVTNFMKKLQVGVTNKQVSTIDLSFDYAIPKRGEDILETLIKKYVEGNLYDKNIIADSTIAFIENRLLIVGEELGDIEGNIQKFRQSSRVTDIEAQSKLLIENSSQYIQELSTIETQLSILNSLEAYLKDDSKNKRVLPSSILPGDMVFNGLIEKYNSLLLERDRQSMSSTETNPYIQNLDQQIRNLRLDMLSNLTNTKSSLTISRDELRARTGQLEGEIRKVPSTQRTYLDMARQQQIKQELYIYLLQKREETAISKTSNISNSKVIDRPKSETEPISPRKMIIVLAGVLLGLAAPLVILYGENILNTRVMNKNDITNITSIPIIAEISNNSTPETVVVTKDSRSAISEQFRSLRTNLSFFLKDGEKVVLLTSSMSGEGKSFISLNMASVLALSGKKVVVMEMDLRKPNLSNKVNVNNMKGFTNFVIDKELTPRDVIFDTEVSENLFVIPSGPIPPNPTETILDKRMDELMGYLNENFDFIVIDAPPIGLVTDAQLLNKYSNLTLYILRQGYTYKNQLNIINDIYANRRMDKIALLVNDISPNYDVSYGYGYGYSYGYGHYGDQDMTSNGKSKFKTFFNKR